MAAESPIAKRLVIHKPQFVYFLDQMSKKIEDKDVKKRLWKCVFKIAVQAEKHIGAEKLANLKLFKALEAVKSCDSETTAVRKLCEIFPSLRESGLQRSDKYLDLNQIHDFYYDNFVASRREYLEAEIQKFTTLKEELLQRLLESEHTKEDTRDLKSNLGFVSDKLNKLQEKLGSSLELNIRERSLYNTNKAVIRKDRLEKIKLPKNLVTSLAAKQHGK